MLKEWIWWQIEAGMEHVGDDGSISLSDLTIGFWMAMVLQGLHVSAGPSIHYGGHIKEMHEPDRLLYGLAWRK